MDRRASRLSVHHLSAAVSFVYHVLAGTTKEALQGPSQAAVDETLAGSDVGVFAVALIDALDDHGCSEVIHRWHFAAPYDLFSHFLFPSGLSA